MSLTRQTRLAYKIFTPFMASQLATQCIDKATEYSEESLQLRPILKHKNILAVWFCSCTYHLMYSKNDLFKIFPLKNGLRKIDEIAILNKNGKKKRKKQVKYSAQMKHNEKCRETSSSGAFLFDKARGKGREGPILPRARGASHLWDPMTDARGS